MKLREIMTDRPTTCTPETGLQEVARMMQEHDCGAIPVVENRATMKLVGIVTDRDITCRTVAQGKNPLQMTARDCMSAPVVTVTPDMSLEECCATMEDRQIRRVPVVDDAGRCCGVVAQADIAKAAPVAETGEVVKGVSQPSH